MLNRLVAPRKAAGHNSDNDGKKYVYIEATSNEKKNNSSKRAVFYSG